MASSELDIVQEAGRIPEYQQMVNYLRAQKAVPSQEVTSFANPLQRGEYLLKTNSIQYAPTADVGTAVHEMVHAVDSRIISNYLKGQYGPEVSSDFRQLRFDENIPTGNAFRANIVQDKVDPKAAGKRDPYFSDPSEMVAFAVQRYLTPDSQRPAGQPNHVDATLATEFFILLDKVSRSQASQPKK